MESGRVKILVMEDDKRIASLLQCGLAQIGNTVDISYLCEEREQLACDSSYDVVILDIKLPDMDGMDVCRALRSSGVHSPAHADGAGQH